MSDEAEGSRWRPDLWDVGSLASAENMTVQAAVDLARMDCDAIRDDVRVDPERSISPGPSALGMERRSKPTSIKCARHPHESAWLEIAHGKVPRGTSEKETGDGLL